MDYSESDEAEGYTEQFEVAFTDGEPSNKTQKNNLAAPTKIRQDSIWICATAGTPNHASNNNPKGKSASSTVSRIGNRSEEESRQKVLQIPDEAPLLHTHASSQTGNQTFQGACLDTGASTSVCGAQQAKAYLRFVGFKFNPGQSQRTFRFGRDKAKSLGTIVVRIPVPGNAYLELKVDVVHPNVPLLMGLDAMDKFTVYVNNVQNLLVHDKLGWAIPLQRINGHVYYKWEEEVLFTISELKKMHLGLYHPSTEKLINLIRRANSQDATGETSKILEQIAAQCRTCQYHSPRPTTFKATVPGGIVFNRQVILDLMWIASKPVLHLIDADTRDSAATFLGGESTEDVWNAFLTCWVSTYVSFPDSVKADHGSLFTSAKWNKHADNSGMAVEITPVESSNSMGVCERYHDALRRIYMKIPRDHPAASMELKLSLATKAMNDTCGPDSLVPSLLVFGTLLRIATGDIGHPNQETCMNMMQTARLEMETVVTKQRIRTVLQRRAPNAAHAILSEGDPVLIWMKLEMCGKHSK